MAWANHGWMLRDASHVVVILLAHRSPTIMDQNDEHDDEIPGTFKRLCLRFEDLISVAFPLR